ncbi:putative Tetratricopeptide repeat protein [Tenacibaculum insulae]
MKSGKKHRNKNPKKALFYFAKALEKAKENDTKTQLAKSYTYLSYANRDLANYPKALDYLFKSLRVNEFLKDSTRIAINYFDMANVNRYINDYENALNYFKNALTIYKSTNDSLNQALTYEAMGIVYRRTQKLHDAEKVYDKAASLFAILKKKRGSNRLKANKARLYIDLKKYKESLSIYFSLLDYYKKKKNERSLQTFYGNIALNYQMLKQHKLAIKYLDSAINISTKNGYRDRTSINLKFRSENYKALKNYKKALNDYQLYKVYNDSIFNFKNSKKIKELELKYSFEKEQLKDSLQYAAKEQKLVIKAEAQKKEVQLYVILLIITALALFCTILFYLYKKRLNIELKEKRKLEFDLLNSKLENINNYTEHLEIDNKMRFQFKEGLLKKIKAIKNNPNTKDLKTYQSLIIDLQTQIQTEKKLNTISEKSNTVNNKLEAILIKQFSDLTKSEREICSLISLNLSNKEIMNVRNVSLDSVKSARYRIRKKMNILKGIELEQFIKDLI